MRFQLSSDDNRRAQVLYAIMFVLSLYLDWQLLMNNAAWKTCVDYGFDDLYVRDGQDLHCIDRPVEGVMVLYTLTPQ